MPADLPAPAPHDELHALVRAAMGDPTRPGSAPMGTGSREQWDREVARATLLPAHLFAPPSPEDAMIHRAARKEP